MLRAEDIQLDSPTLIAGSTSTRASRGIEQGARELNVRVGGSKVISLRVNAQNLFNRQGWGNTNLNPTSTQFGMIATPSGMAMRFITFVTKFSF